MDQVKRGRSGVCFQNILILKYLEYLLSSYLESVFGETSELDIYIWESSI